MSTTGERDSRPKGDSGSPVTWFKVGASIQRVPYLHFIGENMRVLLSLTVVMLGAQLQRTSVPPPAVPLDVV